MGKKGDMTTVFLPLKQYRTLSDWAGQEKVTTGDIMRTAIGECVDEIRQGAVTLNEIKKGAKNRDDSDMILRTLFIPTEQDRRLNTLADRAKVTKADIIRRAFSEFLKKYE